MSAEITAAAPRLARHARRRRIPVMPLLLLPGAGFLALAMALPIAELVLSSLGLSGLQATGLTFAHFETIVADPMLRDAFAFSLRIAGVTTAASIAFALAFAGLLLVDFPGRRLLMTLYKVPLVVPSLIAAFLVMTMIGPGGMAARAAASFGLAWPKLVHDEAGFGIVLVLLWHQIPVTLLIVLAVIVSIPKEIVEAARTLGASPARAFRHVILPLALPGISAAALLVFIDTFGAYAVPSLLGPAYPSALPVAMTREFLERAHWGVASALGVVMVLTTVAVMALYYRLLGAAGTAPPR